MTKFERASQPEITVETIKKMYSGLAEIAHYTDEDWQAAVREMNDCEVWLNDTYQVNIRRYPGQPCDMLHLSIKRIDKATMRVWRDLQEIKNQLVGPECEAVELFPAESRLVDSANQYHLWAWDDPTFRLPFGYTERFVLDGTENLNDKSKQEPRKK